MGLTELNDIKNVADKIKLEIKKVILGVDRVVDLVTASLFAHGHCLLEGPPGQAKTTMFLAFSRAIKGGFLRFQGMPDTLPPDILYAAEPDSKGRIKFTQGQILSLAGELGIILVDEINRFQSKTQAVFLELMQEGHITLPTRTVALPHAIIVATRNPLEKQQTYELPAAQRDRFLMEIELNYPDPKSETQILTDPRFQNMESLVSEVNQVVDLRELLEARDAIQTKVKLSDAIVRYGCEIVASTRDPQKFRISMNKENDPSKWLKAGVSTRGARKLFEAAKTMAALRGDDKVLPVDVNAILVEVLAHRIFVQPFAENRRSGFIKTFLAEIRKSVEAPRA